MATLDFPDVGAPASLRWRLISNTGVATSPLSGASQTYELPGARWGFQANWPPLENAVHATRRRALMRAFLAQLHGRGGRFAAYNWESPTPAGTNLGNGSPSVCVAGASQTGRTLVTRNWSPSKSGLLLPGDYFGVNGELKMVVAQLDSNASGGATVQFEPPLRAAPADGVAIVTNRPTATFMLTDDTVEWAVESGNLMADYSIEAIEFF